MPITGIAMGLMTVMVCALSIEAIRTEEEPPRQEIVPHGLTLVSVTPLSRYRESRQALGAAPVSIVQNDRIAYVPSGALMGMADTTMVVTQGGGHLSSGIGVVVAQIE